jgi:hypothetical protein
VYVPGAIPNNVTAVPNPVEVTPPGFLVRLQEPDDDKPLKFTLPVATAQVGCVMLPTRGADGTGLAAMVALVPDDTHPAVFLAVTVYGPMATPGKIPVVLV